MKRSFPKILYLSFFLLGITLSGFARILPIPSESSAAAPEPNSLDVAAASPTATRVLRPTVPVPPLITFPTQVSQTALYAFVEAPNGPVNIPYVTITGFQAGTFASSIGINGSVNNTDFVCAGSPCTVPLQLGESRMIFTATTPTGLSSDAVYATVVVDLRKDGYHVTITSVSQLARVFSDSCLKLWNVEDTTQPAWAEFPPYPFQLNTRIPLHHLAARLISYGLVDTRDCPAGGLSQDMDWPNGCGLDRATNLMIQWQNQFDDAIWTAAGQIGIPPKILKTLIEVESQFWPGNERFFVDEYGLGQVNQLGVDVLLRNNPDLYRQVCSSVLPNCFLPYVSLPAPQQALIRGALLSSQNTTCTACAFGFDLTKAKQSITFIAQVVKANCQQAKDILDSQGVTTDYESYWEFTLLSYHSGLNCLSTAIHNVKQVGDPVDWEHLSTLVTCPGGEKYVNGFWSQLSLFDSYRYSSGAAPIVQFTPVFAPTRTPLPTATPVISDAKVVVTVYIDSNGDGTPQPAEGLNGIPVQLVFPDGKILSGVTTGGQAVFDLSGYVTGTQISATLPNLYRSYRFYLPQHGTVPIIFSFAQPTLPGKLP
jgi:hypothetical protein